MAERAPQLQGADNFRDLGGYPVPGGGHVRWHRLYRSGSLQELSPADVALLRDELAVGLVVDLRSDWELEACGPGTLQEHGVRILRSPIRAAAARRAAAEDALRAGDLARYYALLLESSAPALAGIVAELADASAAAVIHCAAGKDRTGVVSAVLLGLLGVPDEHIVSDYALTERYRTRVMGRLRRTGAYDAMIRALPAAVHRAEPSTMRAVLQQLRATHGSMSGYVGAAGLAPATLERFRHNLVRFDEQEQPT